MKGHCWRNDMPMQLVSHQRRHFPCIALSAKSLVARQAGHRHLVDEPVIAVENIVTKTAVRHRYNLVSDGVSGGG